MSGLPYFDASDDRVREHLMHGSGAIVVVRRRTFAEGVRAWSRDGQYREDGKVRVERIGTVDPTDRDALREYVDESLHDSAEQWVNHIRRDYTWMLDEAQLYRLEPVE